MSHPSRDPVPYGDVIEAAQGETAAGLEESRIAVVEQRLSAIVGDRPSPFWIRRLLLFAAGTVAGLTVVAYFLWQPPEPRPSAAATPYEVLHLSGKADLEGEEKTDGADGRIRLANGARVTLGAGGRIDAALGRAVRWVLWGPARARISPRGELEIEHGVAVLAIRHPVAAFSLVAGDAKIVARDARFALVGHLNRLAFMGVAEGEVELRIDGEDGPKVRRLPSGASHGALPGRRLDDLIAEGLQRPWWVKPEPSSACLRLETTPTGARAFLDGVSTGECPVYACLSAGVVRVEAESLGHESRQESVRLEADDVVWLRWRLERVAKKTPAAPPGDLWRSAMADLRAKRCRSLDDKVARLIQMSRDRSEAARARALAAECRLRREERERALQMYQRLAAEYGDTTSGETAQFEVAKLTSELEAVEASIAAFEKYLERFPRGRFAAAATFRRCEGLVRLRQLAEANRCLEKYAEAFPRAVHHADSILLRAAILRARSEWATAARLYQEYLQRAPDSRHRETAAYHRLLCMRQGSLPGLETAIHEYLAEYPASGHAAEVRAWKR